MVVSLFFSSIVLVLNLPLLSKLKDIVSLLKKILIFYGGTVAHEEHSEFHLQCILIQVIIVVHELLHLLYHVLFY
jgi:hypothetical protein